MPAGGLATLGVGVALGGYQMYKSSRDKKKAMAAANANKRPFYETPESEQYLEALTMSQAGQGMSDSARQAYMNNSNNGLSATLAAIQRGGGDANSVGNVYGKYAADMNSLALHEDTQRMQHIQNLSALYQRQTANKDKMYQLNQMDPYKDKAAAINQQLQAAQQGQTAGFNTMSSSIMSGMQGMGQSQWPKQNTAQSPMGYGWSPEANQPNATSYPPMANWGQQAPPQNTWNGTGFGQQTSFPFLQNEQTWNGMGF